MKFSDIRFDKMPRMLPRPDLGVRSTELVDPLRCRWGDGDDAGAILVPKGFVTDGPSIPTRLRSITPYTHRQLRPSIVHDWLCEHMQPPWDWALAADLFSASLKAEGVGRVRRTAMVSAVRFFGLVCFK